MKNRTPYRHAPRLVCSGRILAFLLITTLPGCSPDVPGTPVKQLLSFNRTPLFKIDAQAHSLHLSSYFQPSHSEKVYFLNPGNFHFQVLNTTDGSLKLSGILPELDAFDGFIVDEQHRALYVFFSDSVGIYDFRGNPKGGFRLPELRGGYVYQPGNYFPPIVKNGKLFISYFPQIEGSFRKAAYFKMPVEAEMDIKTKKTRLLGQGYPVIYQQSCYSYHYDASRFDLGEGVHGYTFPHSDSLYLYDTRTGERSTRFFGALTAKKFEHIPYDRIPQLHATVFDQLVQKNPHYSFPAALPLAGYYTRELMVAPKKEGDPFAEWLVVFDKDLNYIGEACFSPNILIDSKKGLLSMRMEQNELIIDRISW
jgi:hypothetical protein